MSHPPFLKGSSDRIKLTATSDARGRPHALCPLSPGQGNVPRAPSDPFGRPCNQNVTVSRPALGPPLIILESYAATLRWYACGEDTCITGT